MRQPRLLVTLAAAALVLAACPADDPVVDDAPGEAGAADVTVAAASTALGTVLVDADGMTLYMFDNDPPGESACYDACAATWPPLVAGEPAAGDGADERLVGTTQRDDGETQVTYDGMPLYYFAGDASPGDVEGQGVNDVWWVVAPDGEPIRGSADEDGGADDAPPVDDGGSSY